MPAALAAAQIVVPSGTVISCPSMVSVTVRVVARTDSHGVSIRRSP